MPGYDKDRYSARIYIHSQRYSAPPHCGWNFRLLPFIAEFAFFRGILQKNPISERFRSIFLGKEVHILPMNTLVDYLSVFVGAVFVALRSKEPDPIS